MKLGEPPGAASDPAWHALRGADVLLRLRIQARSAHEGPDGMHGGRLRVRVGAAPVAGAANQRLVELLAALLELPRGRVRIERGAHARDKDVLVLGAAARYADIVTRLSA
jgi:uncharacterized protein (TIGR00251 family)